MRFWSLRRQAFEEVARACILILSRRGVEK
jgi:hypothetical protein